MALTMDQKNIVCKDFNDVILTALEQNNIEASEVPEVAEFFLNNLDTLEHESQLGDLYAKLSEKWPMFKHLNTLQQGKALEAEDREKASSVSTLLQHGKIDDALQMVKKENTFI